MKEAVRRQVGRGGLAACLLVLLAGCSPGGGGELRPSASATPGPVSGRNPVAVPAAGSSGDQTPSTPRPVLLDPIVETRPPGADRSLGEEDLRNLGELGILPHAVQSISGAPCDFNDALSNCQ